MLFIVEEKPQQTIELEKVNEQADQILAEIIEGYVPREKARAIYNWVRGHIATTAIMRTIQIGLKAHLTAFKADRAIVMYFRRYQGLLNRADLENLDIVKRAEAITGHGKPG